MLVRARNRLELGLTLGSAKEQTAYPLIPGRSVEVLPVVKNQTDPFYLEVSGVERIISILLSSSRFQWCKPQGSSKSQE